MDHVEDIKKEGNFDLKPYFNKEVIETGYILNESFINYNEVIFYILESEGNIIGGYLKFNNEVLEGSIYKLIDGKTLPIMNRQEIKKYL
jgi:hypothetical protein